MRSSKEMENQEQRCVAKEASIPLVGRLNLSIKVKKSEFVKRKTQTRHKCRGDTYLRIQEVSGEISSEVFRRLYRKSQVVDEVPLVVLYPQRTSP